MRQVDFISFSGGYYVLRWSFSPSRAVLDGLLRWLGAKSCVAHLRGRYIGPLRYMVSPWGTSAHAILSYMGLQGLARIEHLRPVQGKIIYDPLMEELYESPGQELFSESAAVALHPVPVLDICAYAKAEALGLGQDKIKYLMALAKRIGRPLTESELFGYAQIQSEHCRHHLFRGQYVLNGIKKRYSLWDWIQSTTRTHPNQVCSAYSDNVAFIRGSRIRHLGVRLAEKPSFFREVSFDSALCLKAETHNFPTTYSPFYGAATGTGGEIRDRMAGGQYSLPIAGTAAYMTAYARLNKKPHAWEKPLKNIPEPSPKDILIQASNGASDYANKFGQPLICGLLYTFEQEGAHRIAYDKVVMLAGGVGLTRLGRIHKGVPRRGDVLVVLGGDNYRIGLGGGSVSSGNEGSQLQRTLAIQRAHPEMQKRVYDFLRALLEVNADGIKATHDHGAGGHLNCFVEMLEQSGGVLNLEALPSGDPTLSAKELLCNESQERMGLLVSSNTIPYLKQIAARFRTPFYVVGKVNSSGRIRCQFSDKAVVHLALSDLLAPMPKPLIVDNTKPPLRPSHSVGSGTLSDQLRSVLRLEGVACKDWLTRKVDRCVGGRVAKQPTCGALQLPLNNVGVVQLDYFGRKGMATAMGQAAGAMLLDAAEGAKLALVEALSNLIWAPLTHGLKGVSLSANWMWPPLEDGEGERLYKAVEALSRYATSLGINIPTGKDSLSMRRHYDSSYVDAPGTVILSALAEVIDVQSVVEPVLQAEEATGIFYIPLGNGYFLGGSAWAQTQCAIDGGDGKVPKVAEQVALAFDAIQELIRTDQVLAGHDVSDGGLIVALLEWCFPSLSVGLKADLSALPCPNLTRLLFSQTPALLIQVRQAEVVGRFFQKRGLTHYLIGAPTKDEQLHLTHRGHSQVWNIPSMRTCWMDTSVCFDSLQTDEAHAKARVMHLEAQRLTYRFPKAFKGTRSKPKSRGLMAAVLQESGSNSDRETAFALHRVGFKVLDIHMTDLIHQRIDLSKVAFLAFVGGFSNSDTFGAAAGWAATIQHHPTARHAIQTFYSRPNTLSIGICNGCQLMAHLGILDEKPLFKPETPNTQLKPNTSNKFECVFTMIDIVSSPAVMFSELIGCRLGVWAAHGEGRFTFSGERKTPIAARYAHKAYPINPNGSAEQIAALCTQNGRHLAIMPHMERALRPQQWGYYPQKRKKDPFTPWLIPFERAYKWLQQNQ